LMAMSYDASASSRRLKAHVNKHLFQ
jgi:hypothetical protein